MPYGKETVHLLGQDLNPIVVRLLLLVFALVVGIGMIVLNSGTTPKEVIFRSIGVSVTAGSFFFLADIVTEWIRINAKISLLDEKLQKDTAFQDPDFWLHVLDAISMPIFIKKQSRGDKKHQNLIYNTALQAFEHLGEVRPSARILEDHVIEDHKKGDVDAYNQGLSRKLEIAAQIEGIERPILIEKRVITFRGAKYLIGSYTALKQEKIRVESTKCIRVGQQILFALPDVGPQEINTIDVPVGNSMRVTQSSS